MITFLISPHSFHATLNLHCVPYRSCLHVAALAIIVVKTKRKVTTTTTPTTTTTKTTKVLMPNWLRLFPNKWRNKSQLLVSNLLAQVIRTNGNGNGNGNGDGNHIKNR